jgi:hypothetical protein
MIAAERNPLIDFGQSGFPIARSIVMTLLVSGIDPIGSDD